MIAVAVPASHAAWYSTDGTLLVGGLGGDG